MVLFLLQELYIGKVLLSIDILRGNREIQHPHDVIFRV